MLNKTEAQQLMIDLIKLRKRSDETKNENDIKKYKDYEQFCIKQFMYIVDMHASRYRSFSNYDDLKQEGLESLIKAFKNYNPKKGIFFWWAHKYIGTRISRMANTHTTIRYPLKVARETIPHKETQLPLLIENNRIPEKECEKNQTINIIQNVVGFLNDEHRLIINMVYGLDGDKPKSINKVCKDLNMTRTDCINKINEALIILKNKIRL